MHKGNKVLSCVSMLLILAMIAGVWSVLIGADSVEPENPLPTQVQTPKPESLSEGGILPDRTEVTDATESSTAAETTEEPTEPPTEAESSEPTEPPESPSESTSEPTNAPTEPSTEPESTSAPTEPTDVTVAPSVAPEPTQNPSETTEEPTNVPTEPGTPPVSSEEPSVAPEPSVTVAPTEPNVEPEPTESGDRPLPGEDPSKPDDAEVKIVTDLRSQQLTQDDLPNGIFDFYAYPSVEDSAYSVKAVVQNSATPQNGSTLQSADGGRYFLTLPLNETTTVTLYLKKNGQNLSYARYQLRYDAKKADENTPDVGDNPPTILTSLDGFSGAVESQELLFWVSARSEPDGNPIRADQIEVWLNDTLITAETGDTRPEYLLYFEAPIVGDSAQYTVKVVAWDGKGNSAMKQYTLEYRAAEDGATLGEVTLVLDATTVGLGVLDSAVFEIKKGDTAAGAVIRFLEEYGYDADYDGSENVGFYLRSVGRADLCSGAAIPERLRNMLERDGIAMSGYSSTDSLREYDYTMGSGWMYAIDGSIFPSRGLSDYPLSGNTTICLRFTLAYGKDIGGSDTHTGNLSSYCGAWVNGGYTPLPHELTETDRREATDTEDGYVEYTCVKCGEVIREPIPALGTETADLPRSRRRTEQKRTERT